MTVTATTGTTGTTTSGTTASTTSSTTSEAASTEYQTFLKMLTTQMQNQDPTDPMDTKEFAVQLATFSSVEQQVKTNDLLGEVISSLGQLGMTNLASWVGCEARVSGEAYFDGDPITLSIEPTSGADTAVLSVRNASGTIVSQETLSSGAQTMEWAGTDSSGNVLSVGKYTFSLDSYSGDTVLSTNPVGAYSEIVEARSGTEGTELVLTGGIEVSSSDVTALRRPN